MSTATERLIALAESLNATGVIGDGTVAEFHALAARAWVEQANTALALRPFADCVEQIDPSEPDDEWAKFRLLVGDYRRAALALDPGGADKARVLAMWRHLLDEYGRTYGGGGIGPGLRPSLERFTSWLAGLPL